MDFDKGEILVRGDPETGTKNWAIRRVPMIADMVALIRQLRSERAHEASSAPVMEVRECQKAMARAAKLVGMPRITHHDLRHLFAARRKPPTHQYEQAGITWYHDGNAGQMAGTGSTRRQ